MAIKQPHELNWKKTDIDKERSLPAINWDALQEYAIALRQAQGDDGPPPTCNLLPQYNMGGLHIIRLLQFNDGARWVARIQLHSGSDESAKRLLHEVHTLSVIREQRRVPVPEVFGYESTTNNPVGVAFILMDFVPGDSAMDSFGGWHAHHGKIPSRYKSKFYHQVAQMQADLASIRFPMIGRITQRSDGSFAIDAIPGIGGPFSTAADYLEAWSQNAKFPVPEKELRSMLPPDLEDELILSIQRFPAKLAASVRRIPLKDGPFPLYHPDLFHSNIIIDSDYNVLSIIDWENACTVPWEVVQFPMFLASTPPPMDAPWNYDDAGEPTNQEIRERWQEQKEYLQSVMEAEERRKLDHMLSSTLADRDVQNLAGAIKLYLDPGKIGYYCKVLDCLRFMLGDVLCK
ncbi:hypothetical protein QQZ08_010258 [Neonectria magnoliae]|uniref:Aminoglycoside phosphotransferase domain-containing protein n=1 Tax=Neonectria magnoliae TaxID=2732573 RepID=A0ABR1HJ24_9HYPO